MPQSPTYSMEIDGEQYEFNDDRDLTLSALRHIKQWYPELGTYNSFRLAYLNGDPDALACVRWIVLRGAGKPNVPEPKASGNFSLGDFMNSWLSDVNEPCEHCGGVNDGGVRRPGRGWNPVSEPEPVEANPTTPDTSPMTDSTPVTPTNSEASISDSSESSAI